MSQRTEIVLPDLRTAPAVLSVWFADAGETVFEGDRLVEVLVSGATFDVAAPATGRLVEKRARPAEVLQAGQVLGIVEVDETESPKSEARMTKE
jgi:pyruvate/2-oxoglutarate dehydrogenase complex dihydrolipoamide acyltransferase (E2) component